MIECSICHSKFNSTADHCKHYEFTHRAGPSSRLGCEYLPCTDLLKSLEDHDCHVNTWHRDNYNDPEEYYKCAFAGCNYKSKSKSTLRSHKFRCHSGDDASSTLCFDVASSNIIDSMELEEPPILVDHFNENEAGDLEMREPASVPLDIGQKLSLMSISVTAKYHVPDSTLAYILDTYYILLKEASSITCEKLMIALKDQREDTIDNIVLRIMSGDPLLLLHCPEGPLRSRYCRRKEYEKQFKAPKPIHEDLGVNKFNEECHYHRISIKESLQFMFSDDSVYEQYLQHRQRKSVLLSDDLSDLHCGSVYTSNEFFSKDPNVIELVLYQDDIDLAKALGAACGTYKVNHMGFTLGNLEPWCRSKVDPLQLILLCKDKDVDYFSLQNVLKPVLLELKDLETNGVYIRGENLKASVLVLLGDNLGQHTIGGFYESFSSTKFFCRYCEESRAAWKARWSQDSILRECSDSESDSESDHSDSNSDTERTMRDSEDSDDDVTLADLVPFSELKGKSSGSNKFWRTINSYQKCVEELEKHPNGVRGVVADSPMNELKSFHVVVGTLPCVPHDIFEGFAPYDIQLCLKKLHKTYKFPIEDLNRRVKKFKFDGTEKKDKPPRKFDMARKKVKGNAVQIWTFIRFLPLLLGDKVKKW